MKLQLSATSAFALHTISHATVGGLPARCPFIANVGVEAAVEPRLSTHADAASLVVTRCVWSTIKHRLLDYLIVWVRTWLVEYRVWSIRMLADYRGSTIRSMLPRGRSLHGVLWSIALCFHQSIDMGAPTSSLWLLVNAVFHSLGLGCWSARCLGGTRVLLLSLLQHFCQGNCFDS